MELQQFLKSKNVRHNLQQITVKEIVNWFDHWKKTELKKQLELAYKKGVDSAIRMINENRDDYIFFYITEGDEVIWNGVGAKVIEIRANNYALIKIEYEFHFEERLVSIKELKPAPSRSETVAK